MLEGELEFLIELPIKAATCGIKNIGQGFSTL